VEARREGVLLGLLCAVQVTHVMDFMVMMPLGPQLMRSLDITPGQFGTLVASYGVSAAVAGLAGAFVLDRVDRRRALLWAYAAFGLATLACALAPGFAWLMAARIAAGAAGGIAGSVVGAIIADVVPGERRGAAMGRVQVAFPIASVMGVPFGLALAGWFSWHAPFLLIAAAGVPIWVLARKAVPALPPKERDPSVHPVREVAGLFTDRVHQRALVFSFLLVMTGSCVIPFMAPSMVSNAGLSETSLPLIYLCGGAVTFFSTPWLGRMADRRDKLRLLLACTALASAMALVVTHLGPAPVPLVLVITTLFMLGMSSRFVPGMAMVTNRIGAGSRGGFMSVNGSLQQLGAASGAYVAGHLVTLDAGTGRLVGYERAGYLAVVFAVLTLAAARWLVRSGPELHLSEGAR
jgi:predicted MFS family arabinose efflux permease